jgi:hypothetical protein
MRRLATGAPGNTGAHENNTGAHENNTGAEENTSVRGASLVDF